ncbi:MAG: hypothetical protein ACYDA2_03600 [Acidimicrobiales bacterium]
MARGDTGKWVQRAAATGGGRTYRGRMPVRWYGSLVLIVLLGAALVAYSRYERQHPTTATAPAVGTHWYAAMAFDICGKVQPNLPANPNQATAAPGLFTAGDGVLQVSPAKAADAGNNATLGRFVSLYPGLSLTPTSLKLPGKSTLVNGQKCPSGTPDAGKVANVRVQVWPSFSGPQANHPVTPSDPTTLKIANGQLITVAFVPTGASVPKPPATAITTMLQDISSQSSPSTTLPSSVPSTSAPTLTTTTTAPAATTTTAPAATTTTTG